MSIERVLIDKETRTGTRVEIPPGSYFTELDYTNGKKEVLAICSYITDFGGAIYRFSEEDLSDIPIDDIPAELFTSRNDEAIQIFLGGEHNDVIKDEEENEKDLRVRHIGIAAMHRN